MLCILFTSLFFSSCKKERIKLPWIEIDTPSSYKITDIHFQNEEIGYISAGKDWSYGEILTTEDGGETWITDSIDRYIVSGITEDKDGMIHFNGFFGLYGHWGIDGWETYSLDSYSPYDDISVIDGNKIFSVSGEAFNTGIITVNDYFGNIISSQKFDHDFEAIDHVDENNIVACGYGQIIHSKDGGNTWDILPITGDYFKDVQFIDENVGYICGYNGSILKSTNAGASWNFLRDGDKILVKDKRFAALHFVDEELGFLVGNGGLCWRTINGGDKWQVVKNLPDYDFTTVFTFDNHAFIGSKEGKLLRLDY